MLVKPAAKSGKSPLPRPESKVEVRAPGTPTPNPNQENESAKKKKKKKGKGRSTTTSTTVTGVSIAASVDIMDEDEGDEDMPPLEAYKAPASFTHARARTRLSPDLESVHLSTTASLTAARQGLENLNLNKANGNGDGAHKELLEELYRKVGFEVMEDEMRKNLDSLPGVRSFIKSAVAAMDAEDAKDKEKIFHSFSQQLLQSSGLANSGTIKTGNGGGGVATLDKEQTGNRPPGLEPNLLQMFQRLVRNKKTTDNEVAEWKAAALRAGVVLATSRDFDSSDSEVFEDDMFSEDELDDGGAHTDKVRRGHGWAEDTAGVGVGTGAIEAVYCDLGEEPAADAVPPGAYPEVEVGKPRYSGKGKSVTVTEPNGPKSTVVSPRKSSSTNTPAAPMPPARNANPPPPSARAAGKQPMAYPPAQPTSTTTNTPPPRSARAAAKAPAPPQSYANHTHPHHNPSPPVSNASQPQKHRPPGSSGQGASNAKANSKIWNTNTAEERERIKEFWLGLSERERRQLVEIEKETVLKRMKEQQKHSCTCAVCGRKRNAIEEELEVLYDAYYEELEQYANYQQRYASSGGTLPPPPGPGPFPGSVELDKDGLPVGTGKPHVHSHPPSGRVKSNALTNGPKKGIVPDSEFDEDDADADEYDEEEDDEEEDEEDEEYDEDVDAEDDVEIRNRSRTLARGRNRGVNGTKANGRDGLFNFGSSLTVAGPGNILTVADDLLKNDGQKFLEMMEQLAERRMQREEDAARDVEDDSEEEDDEDGDEDEEGDEEEEDDDEDDEEEAMTEEQKIAEGKRMFSIFAARMFEQRVLQAYREKVAQERQRQLLQELEEEEQVKNQREAKKAKENQRKKDKKRQQKMAKEEERAAKLAAQAAEESAQKEKQRKLEEEQRKKKEEERLKKEAAKKAADEERARKEEERRKRLEAEKEQQAERERKRKEKEERLRAERKDREEKERKAREEREAKLAAERAEKAKKEQQEKEEREKRLAKEKEEKEKAEREAKERQAKEQQQARAAAAVKRPPSSPRVNASASGSRQQQQNVAPKKILSKPSTQPSTPIAPTPTPAVPAQLARQSSRPGVSTPQQAQPSQSAGATASPTTPANVAPSTPTFPQSATTSTGLPPAMMSPPRPPFPPGAGTPGFGGFVPHMPVQPPLGPSPMHRPFGAPPPFEPGFGRGLGAAAPIGPPSKVGIPSSLSSPILPPGSTMPNRRMSSAADPGPIGRPVIAPIARPTNGPNGVGVAVNGDSSGSAPGSGGASPSRRSPSPKGVLGSSALAADDDEVVTAPATRRAAPGPGPVGAIGQVWHSPRGSMAVATPWNNSGPGAPGQGFSPSRSVGMPGANAGGALPGYGGLWGTSAVQGSAATAPGVGAGINDWQSPSAAFFGTSPFIHQNHSAATPPPHSTGN